MNNAHTDLFDLMSRWDVEANVIPSYLMRRRNLSQAERHDLLVRRATLVRVVEELRDAMAAMPACYRGLVDGKVVIEANTEEECWAVVHDAGTVEFQLCTVWAPTDNALEHRSPVTEE